jgi:hypothetical protein
MNTPTKLQFSRLPREAQRATLWRLAWTGLSVEQIAERTGCPVEQIRRTIDEEVLASGPPHWRSDRSYAVNRFVAGSA